MHLFHPKDNAPILRK